jgi:uroporphyrinogen III methyltransferase/synthase
VARLSDYHWLVFTSQNGVRAFFTELQAQGGDARRLGSARVAAIGPSTADAIRPYGIVPDLLPESYRGEALAESMRAEHAGDMQGVRVLLPRAAVARDALPEMLRESGATVDVIEAYRTYGASDETAHTLRELVDTGQLDVITFTASSTVEHTLAALGDAGRLAGLTLASIGPITTQTANARGLTVALTADEYTIPGLVDALERHFTKPSHP